MNATTFDHLVGQPTDRDAKRRADFKAWRKRDHQAKVRERLVARMVKSQPHCQTCGKRFQPEGLYRDRPHLVEAEPAYLVCRQCHESGVTQ